MINRQVHRKEHRLASHGAERALPFRLPYALLRTWNVIMATKFTRQALYDLLWSKPKAVVAAELGLSDVGLGKISPFLPNS